jgi:hypothetical protein
MNIHSPSDLDPGDSLFGVCSVSAIVLAVFACSLWRFLALRRRVQQARLMPDRPPALGAGLILLRGEVESADGPPLRIEIEQLGSERETKHGWRHEWAEFLRNVYVQPIGLRLGDGQLVTVIPDERVVLAMALETVPSGQDQRQRVARLMPGASAWLSGSLERSGHVAAARAAGASTWTLRGSARHPLQITSTPLEAQFSAEKDLYASVSAWLGIALALTLTLSFPFYLLLATGKVGNAMITDTKTYGSERKGHKHTRYVVYAKLATAGGVVPLEAEIGSDLHAEIGDEIVKELPFVYAPAAPSIYSLGTRPTISETFVRFGLGLTLVLVFTLVAAAIHARPWYRRKQLTEGGKGRLHEPS